MGFIVYGHPHSPIVPALLYSPAKIASVKKKTIVSEKESSAFFSSLEHSIVKC